MTTDTGYTFTWDVDMGTCINCGSERTFDGLEMPPVGLCIHCAIEYREQEHEYCEQCGDCIKCDPECWCTMKDES